MSDNHNATLRKLRTVYYFTGKISFALTRALIDVRESNKFDIVEARYFTELLEEFLTDYASVSETKRTVEISEGEEEGDKFDFNDE